MRPEIAPPTSQLYHVKSVAQLTDRICCNFSVSLPLFPFLSLDISVLPSASVIPPLVYLPLWPGMCGAHSLCTRISLSAAKWLWLTGLRKAAGGQVLKRPDWLMAQRIRREPERRWEEDIAEGGSCSTTTTAPPLSLTDPLLLFRCISLLVLSPPPVAV